MFRHRQQLRRWAARVLLLWLFGVAAGVANACLTPHLDELTGPSHEHLVPLAHVHQNGNAGEATPHHASDLAPPHDAAPEHQGPHAKSNCQDFCDRASVSIPPLKSALDDVQAHAFAMPALAVILPVPAYRPVEVWVPRREGVLAPPILFAFLRLAL